jgi:hypothetical protein
MEGEVIMKTHITDAWIPSVAALLLASITVPIVFGVWENTFAGIEVDIVFSLSTAVPISCWAVVTICCSQVWYRHLAFWIGAFPFGILLFSLMWESIRPDRPRPTDGSVQFTIWFFQMYLAACITAYGVLVICDLYRRLLSRKHDRRKIEPANGK